MPHKDKKKNDVKEEKDLRLVFGSVESLAFKTTAPPVE